MKFKIRYNEKIATVIIKIYNAGGQRIYNTGGQRIYNAGGQRICNTGGLIHSCIGLVL